MSGVSGVGGGSQLAEVMKMLEDQQEQSIDMVKKLIGASMSNKVSAAEAEGKGGVLDLYA